MFTWIWVFFTVFLKNRNFLSKIQRSKVTDYATLSYTYRTLVHNGVFSIVLKAIQVDDKIP